MNDLSEWAVLVSDEGKKLREALCFSSCTLRLMLRALLGSFLNNTQLTGDTAMSLLLQLSHPTRTFGHLATRMSKNTCDFCPHGKTDYSWIIAHMQPPISVNAMKESVLRVLVQQDPTWSGDQGGLDRVREQERGR